MKNTSYKSILASIGFGSLLLYVLACTAFSPDDRQVLYPSFDPQSGATSISVYDRQTGKSDIIYTAFDAVEGTNRQPMLLRGQWLPDGKHVLVAHPAPGNHDGLSFYILPRGVKEPVRHFTLKVREPALSLQFPFCIIGTTLIMGDEKLLATVDLITGQSSINENTNKLIVLPGGDGTAVAAASDTNGDGETAFGTLNPKTLEFKPAMTLPKQNSKECSFPTFNSRSGQVLFISDTETNSRLHVLKKGQETFSRPLERNGAKMMFGPWLELGPRGDRVYTAYASKMENAEATEFGAAEIPLNHEAIRWIPLFHSTNSGTPKLPFAQASLSHDGQTWAIATSYLYMEDKSFKAEDCALFLVEVGQAKPKITKVRITPPTQRRPMVE